MMQGPCASGIPLFTRKVANLFGLTLPIASTSILCYCFCIRNGFFFSKWVYFSACFQYEYGFPLSWPLQFFEQSPRQPFGPSFIGPPSYYLLSSLLRRSFVMPLAVARGTPSPSGVIPTVGDSFLPAASLFSYALDAGSSLRIFIVDHGSFKPCLLPVFLLSNKEWSLLISDRRIFSHLIGFDSPAAYPSPLIFLLLFPDDLSDFN
jgi:hypothetical protein